MADDLLQMCTSKWLELNDAEKDKWICKVNGDEMGGFRAFMDDCLAQNTQRKSQYGRTTSNLRWLGLFMGKP